MNFKFKENLFLEVIELEKFKESLDSKGFRKTLIDNTESYGLIKNSQLDPSFLNGKVEQDLDTLGGDKTIKIRELNGVDSAGQLLYLPLTSQVIVPDDGEWHWVRVRHKFSPTEKGLFSIGADGTLTGSSEAELLSIFRGMPNFPTRIKFVGSAENILEYDVLEVIDNQTATLQHPALTIGGDSEFFPETELQIQVVGTFTPGVVIASGDKFPFQYDSCEYELVQETVFNTKPTFTTGIDFFLARVKVDTGVVIIQDKRIDYWQTKASQSLLRVDNNENPLIGVESIRFNHQYSPAHTNILEIAWGMRSDNFTVNTTLNQVTLSSGLGGKFKSTTDFTNGDFNGWRVYTQNGSYSKIISSIKSGSSINLVLDVLDVDNYSTDGGTTFTAQTICVVPDSENIIIKCIPEPTDTQTFMEKSFPFPINFNNGIAKIELVVYKTPSCDYNIQYRYKTFKLYSEYLAIPDDTVSGYYTEESFDVATGEIKDIGDRVRQTYTSDPVNGFITLTMANFSFINFKRTVDKGDIVGVQTNNNFSFNSNYLLTVGSSKQYNYFTGTITLTVNSNILLRKVNAVEGNEFFILLNCSDIVGFGTYVFRISESTTDVDDTPITLKEFTTRDIREMQNRRLNNPSSSTTFLERSSDKSLVFRCIYDGTNWIITQNYSLSISPPYAIIPNTPIIAHATDPLTVRQIGSNTARIEGRTETASSTPAGSSGPYTLFTLPVRFRPIRQKIILVPNMIASFTTNHMAIVEINPDGTVVGRGDIFYVDFQAGALVFSHDYSLDDYQ